MLLHKKDISALCRIVDLEPMGLYQDILYKNGKLKGGI